MKLIKYKYLHYSVWLGLLMVTLSACQDEVEPLITEPNLSNVLTPNDLRAFVRNETTIELDWNLRDNADAYVVEFSEDSLEFSSIIRTVTVLPDSLPLQEPFFGDTRYSARVKAVSDDPSLGESNWATVTIRTQAENIFSSIQDGDIAEGGSVTLRWPANSEVTRLLINPGNIERVVTAEEDAAGLATVTGLDPLTEYDVQVFSGNSPRGTTFFTTLIDPNCANCTEVSSTDDLSATLTTAPDGQILVLRPGDYLVNDGETIDLDKSVTIRGLFPYDRPMLHVQFDIEAGANEIAIIDLEMVGDMGVSLTTLFDFDNEGEELSSISISGCYIHDYGRQLIYGNKAATLGTFSVDNSVIEDFLNGGGDFIDFRTAFVSQIRLTNSSFINTPSTRDFIRYDAASGYTGTGLTGTITIDHCTLVGVADDPRPRRLFYVRFDGNSTSVTNTIIANTQAIFSDNSATEPSDLANNNYIEAAGFHMAGDGSYIDEGSFSTLDPEFLDADANDFTVQNQTLIDNEVGDPRWLP